MTNPKAPRAVRAAQRKPSQSAVTKPKQRRADPAAIDRGEIAKMGVTVTTSLVTAMASTSGPLPWIAFLVTAAGAAGNSLLTALIDNQRKRSEAAGRAWFDALVGTEGTTPEAMAAAIGARLHDPDALRVVSDHVRKLQEIDPELAPALSALTGQYLNRKPDAFFRGATGLLVECTPDEARDVRRLLKGMLALDAAVTNLVANVRPNQRDGAISLDVTASAGRGRREIPLGDFEDPIRIFELLKRHVAREAPVDTTRYVGNAAGPDSMQVMRATAERLVALLRFV